MSLPLHKDKVVPGVESSAVIARIMTPRRNPAVLPLARRRRPQSDWMWEPQDRQRLPGALRRFGRRPRRGHNAPGRPARKR